jgi:hypothetical protein
VKDLGLLSLFGVHIGVRGDQRLDLGKITDIGCLDEDRPAQRSPVQQSKGPSQSAMPRDERGFLKTPSG